MTMTPVQKEILIRNYVSERLYNMPAIEIEKKCAALMFDVLIKFDDEQLMKLELI
tara:strand:+ start:446 stop:610 length:165 start_codon:yes stop_codon:yes gene_type:complete